MKVAVIRWVRRVFALAAVTCVLVAGWVYVQVQRTAGGFEEWVGDTVSDIRTAHPALVGPVAWLEDHVHEYSYRLSLMSHRDEASGAATGEDGSDRGGAAGSSSDIALTSLSRGGNGQSQGADGQAARGDAQVASIPRPGRMPITGIDAPVRWSPYPDPQLAWLKVARVVANSDFPQEPSLALLVSTKDAQIHWQPGSLHPCKMGPDKRPLPDDLPGPDRSGKIPAPDLQAPLVAFGGGFESTGFRMYGAVHQGRVVVPLTLGQQTVVIYNDGSIKMGPWGSKGLPTEDIREARQNLPPLVHQGRIPNSINWLNVGTRNVKSTFDGNNHRIFEDVHTWRSGMGLTASGDIVYVFGPRLTPELLAATLIRVGAVEAMQLDVNAAYHCAPAMFKPGPDGAPALVELYPGVVAGKRFVSGSRKDFFFIQSRNESQRGA